MSSRIILNATVICMLEIASTHAGLLTHVDSSQTGKAFSYTVFNDEPLGSSNFLSLWHLNVNAPFSVSSVPTSWDYVTDFATFID